MINVTAKRIGDKPIITPHMDSRMGENINGPSVIRVPDWVKNPLGRYYLYFGHHNGTYIRLAYSDKIAGPWKMHEPGVLPLADSGFAGHLASPDILIDHAAKKIRLYFHGSDHDTSNHDVMQPSRLAVSEDGLNFKLHDEIIENPYLRVFQHDGWYHGIAMPGIFYRSRDGLNAFEEGPKPFEANVRHYAVLKRDETLLVFYSRIGDRPERILCTCLDISGDWKYWKCSDPVEVLAPEMDYEGGNLPLVASAVGMAYERKRELRDPAIYEEGGETYLLYSVAGESGIGLAEIMISWGGRQL